MAQLTQELAAAQAEIHALRETLQLISKWESHTPEFAVDYGSNGVRDLYRNLAKEALATTTDDTALRALIAKHCRLTHWNGFNGLVYANKIEDGRAPL